MFIAVICRFVVLLVFLGLWGLGILQVAAGHLLLPSGASCAAVGGCMLYVLAQACTLRCSISKCAAMHSPASDRSSASTAELERMHCVVVLVVVVLLLVALTGSANSTVR